MSAKNHKKNILLLPAILLVVIVAFGYGALHWYISYVKASADLKISSIVQDDEKALYGHRLASILKEIEPYTDELSAYGVNSEEIVGFINKVEGLSGKSGADVSIVSINVPDENAEANTMLQPIVLNISIGGSWGSVMRAVEMFENFPYKVSFNKVRLVKTGINESTGKSAGGSAWQAQFEMSVLRLK